MKKLITGLVLGTALLAGGCASTQPADPKVDVVAELKDAQKPLYASLIEPLDKDKPLLVTSFANIDNLTESSTFGRLSADLIAAGLTDRGYKLIEVKMRDSLFIKQGAGEFMLSRQVQHLSQKHDAQAVLLGTYAVGGSNVYLNVRLVRSRDNIVLSTYDFQLPINKDIKHMLNKRR
ncbi:MAG: FlgO family outer membrane protein [Amphritea sp.]|nr:FlgO family outer membrane protein [Amphritea sp.]